MQKGEVISPLVTTLDWMDVFLFSAIARPGNSGGPIVAENGMILGLVARDLGPAVEPSVMPFFAGVPSSRIRQAVSEMVPDLTLPIEA